MVVCSAVAALIFWQRSDELVLLLLSLFLVLNGSGGNFYSELSQAIPAWSLAVAFLAYLSTTLFVPLFYLFPAGRGCWPPCGPCCSFSTTFSPT